MKTTIKKIGNSTGLILPSKLVKELNLTVGKSLRVGYDKDCIVLTPVKQKYTLAELLAECDLNSPDTRPILKNWENLVPVGKEVTD